MTLILNLPRPVTLKFSGAYFDYDKVGHPTETDADGNARMADNPLKKFRGMEMKLHAGINHVVDELAFDPRVRPFIVKPDDEAARPMAPAPSTIPTGNGGIPQATVAMHVPAPPTPQSEVEVAAAAAHRDSAPAETNYGQDADAAEDEGAAAGKKKK